MTLNNLNDIEHHATILLNIACGCIVLNGKINVLKTSSCGLGLPP
jgi:hypothetical protein